MSYRQQKLNILRLINQQILSYNIEILDNMYYGVNKSVNVQETYVFNVNDNMYYGINKQLGIQKTYAFDVLDNVYYSVNKFLGNYEVKTGIFPSTMQTSFPIDYQFIFLNEERLVRVTINNIKMAFVFDIDGFRISLQGGDILLADDNYWYYEGNYENDLKNKTIKMYFN